MIEQQQKKEGKNVIIAFSFIKTFLDLNLNK
jgi:hypothetical protein